MLQLGLKWKIKTMVDITPAILCLQYCDQVSISSRFNEQLLNMQIPKAQKESQVKQLFALLRFAGMKAARKHIDEIDPRYIFYESST